jgi:hypothetical protein
VGNHSLNVSSCLSSFARNELLVLFCEEQAAGLAIADVLADLVRQTPPDVHALDDHRHLTRIAPLLPDPAPVAARLFAGDMPFLAQDHVYTLFRQEPCGRYTDDAAADDDDAG